MWYHVVSHDILIYSFYTCIVGRSYFGKIPKPTQTLEQDTVSDLLDYLVWLITMDFWDDINPIRPRGAWGAGYVPAGTMNLLDEFSIEWKGRIMNGLRVRRAPRWDGG